MRKGILSTFVLLNLTLLSCVTPRVTMEVPEGFSRFQDTEDLEMISAEGILLRARLIENAPEQTVSFWATALDTHMTDSGYTLLDEGSVDNGEGVWFEWIAPVGGEDWVYLNAIFVQGGHIVLIESAAEEPLYRECRSALLDVLPSVSIQ